MKIISFISLILVSGFVKCQIPSDIIGQSYISRDEVGFDTLIHHDSRVTIDRLICRHFSDSNFTSHYLILEQEEISKTGQRQNKILDFLKIKYPPYPAFTLIGSNEYEKENNGFVVSIEPFKKNKNDEYVIPDESKRIYKVWFTESNKFHKISRFRINRYYEGFYKKF